MADMLSNGVSGLLAFQKALNTTTHNISNVNTPGYSRQSVVLNARPATALGSSWIGSGVDVTAVKRNYDSILAGQVRSATSAYQQLEAYGTLATSLTNVMSDGSTGLSASLQNFADSLQTLSSAPSDTATRQTVLSQAGTLVTRLKSFQTSLDQLSDRVETSISDEITEVNSLTTKIADLNKQIVAAKGQSQGTPNDLLDQRDELINELSTHVNITTVAADDGSLSVYSGSGQALVMGTASSSVVAVTDPFNPDQARIGVKSGSYVSDITASVTGGTLGGLLQFRSEMLDPAQDTLGQIAVGVASQFNALQAQGLDLNGDIGTDLFNVGAVAVAASSNNTGSASISATRSDVAALTDGASVLSYDGTDWSMVDSDGNSVALSGTGTSADPLLGAGLSIVISGTAAAGDKFQIDPYSGAVNGMSVALSDPNKIAAAAQLVTSASSSNTGTGSIDAGTVTDTSAWVRGDYTLSFTSATDYTVTDASGNTVATGTYTAGSAIDFNGVEVTISGAPASGDSFAINDNIDGSGDNRNVLSMVDAFDDKTLKSGTTSVNNLVDSFTSDLGARTSQVTVARDAQQSTLDDATAALQGVSGVNLDEEAARMIQYQQAYQAAAQAIAVANTLFDSLLSAVRS
ncbi:MAG: flagellar hook-associated protein FlgK [Steroidobacteraceae bacterium]